MPFNMYTLRAFQKAVAKMGVDTQLALRKIWLKEYADKETFGEFILRIEQE